MDKKKEKMTPERRYELACLILGGVVLGGALGCILRPNEWTFAVIPLLGVCLTALLWCAAARLWLCRDKQRLLAKSFTRPVRFALAVPAWAGATWLLYLLPLGGLLIVWLYRLRGMHPTDTNGVLLAIHAPTSIPGSTAPLIFIGTTITHLFGGSAGREGAALQLGGVLGYQLGKALRLDEKDIHLIVMCGMSSVFSALFGTPLTATFFALEVISVGIIHYSAFIPCLLSAVLSYKVSLLFGIIPETYLLPYIPLLSMASFFKTIAIGIVCAVASIIFCVGIFGTNKLFKKWLRNPYLRIFVGGVIIVALTFFLGTTDYR